MDTVLTVILIVLCTLLLAFNAIYAVQNVLKSRMFRARKRARNEERSRAQEQAKSEEELPEDVLLAILTAAVASVYSQRKNVRFRVVSFGRIGKTKN